ncbi:MAG: ATP-binding cassette domain-containing protein, partial [Planctomycetes bacterium]|nr:ATP-binding cassette domain-containing protein [Planctomycetota bacterium]
MPDSQAVLRTEKITKRFPGLTAIDHVDFSMRPGEIRAIMGENGAGKSTFCNMVTGIYPPDEGKVFFAGNEVRFTHPRQALDAGISMVYQERNLIPFLNGAESICLGLE